MAKFSLSEVTMTGEFSVDVLKVLHSNLRFNEHGTLYYEGYISHSKAKVLMGKQIEQSEMRVFLKSIHIFSGMIMRCEIEETGVDSYYMKVWLNTSSKKADYDRPKRFYQNESQTYSSVIEEAFNDSNLNSHLISTIEAKRIKGPILQYQETDWELSKRMAGYAETILIANELADTAEIIIGIPKRPPTTLSNDMVTDCQQIKTFEELLINNSKEPNYGYIIRSINTYSLGDTLIYKGEKWLVVEKCFVSDDEFIEGVYTLGKEDWYHAENKDNKKISGLELQGTVLKCSGTGIKIKLDIGQFPSSKCDFWYTFEPVTNNGMYSMPVVGEKVILQWQSSKDSDVICSHCYRLNSSSMLAPENKYMKTEHDVEMSFLPSSVTFTIPGHSVKFQKNGIRIKTDNNIYISVGGTFESMSRGRTSIQSSEQINIIATKKQSAIVMQLENIDIISKNKTNLKVDPKGEEIGKISRGKLATFSITTNTAASVVGSIPSKGME